jgi:hypothetical protein
MELDVGVLLPRFQNLERRLAVHAVNRQHAFGVLYDLAALCDLGDLLRNPLLGTPSDSVRSM